MFERYTENARRTIFFARYEASQFGSDYIESEHLLLGLLRADRDLAVRFFNSRINADMIRKRIEAQTTARQKRSTSVDLPLSSECKRILAYAAEEAERLSHRDIRASHLLLGILREEKCLAAEILHEHDLMQSTARSIAAQTGAASHWTPGPSWSEPIERPRMPEGCMEFVEVGTFRRLGILGMGGPVPRKGEVLELPKFGRLRVVQVIYSYAEYLEGSGYRVDRLYAIQVQVVSERPIPQGASSEPLEST